MYVIYVYLYNYKLNTLTFKLSILTLTNTTTSNLYGMENLNFFDLNELTKTSLMIFMIFGKVEIIAVLYLIKKVLIKE